MLISLESWMGMEYLENKFQNMQKHNCLVLFHQENLNVANLKISEDSGVSLQGSSLYKNAIIIAFEKTCQNIRYSNIDTQLSGTTACTVLIVGDKLLCANVGDSRAIVGRYTNQTLQANSLSHDHKPNVPEEAHRIFKQNGRIGQIKSKFYEFFYCRS